MKKMLLVISLLFTMNLNAAEHWAPEDMKTSYCYYMGYDWFNGDSKTYNGTTISSNMCHNILQIYSLGTSAIDGTQGIGSEYTYNRYDTANDHGGSMLLAVVDVFGLPATEPTVMYKYKTLPLYAYNYIVNYDDPNDIVVGQRYYFLYEEDTDWGPRCRSHNPKNPFK